MFSTLESTWDQSARRGWTALASFVTEAFALSLLFAISLIWVGPPQVRWLQISAPASFSPHAAPATEAARGHHTAAAVRVVQPEQIVAPPSTPDHIAPINDLGPGSIADAPAALDYGQGWARGPGVGVARSVGDGFIPMVIPARPAPVKPLLVSHLAEAALLHRVQPVYPPLARQARVQGAVELRAIIGKTGAIENLVVVRGHPMLATAAVEAVKQWRYRPYLLNGEPIEVETDITVNFFLSGG